MERVSLRCIAFGLTLTLQSLVFATPTSIQKLCELSFFKGTLTRSEPYKALTQNFLREHFPTFGLLLEHYERVVAHLPQLSPEDRKSYFTGMRLLQNELIRSGAIFDEPFSIDLDPTGTTPSKTERFLVYPIQEPGTGILETLRSEIPIEPYPIRFVFLSELPLIRSGVAFSLNHESAILLPLIDVLHLDRGASEIHEITHQLAHRAHLQLIHENNQRHRYQATSFFIGERLILTDDAGLPYLARIDSVEAESDDVLLKIALLTDLSIEDALWIKKDILKRRVKSGLSLNWTYPPQFSTPLIPHIRFELQMSSDSEPHTDLVSDHFLPQAHFRPGRHILSDEVHATLAEAVGHLQHYQQTQSAASYNAALDAANGAKALAETFMRFLRASIRAPSYGKEPALFDSLLPRLWVPVPELSGVSITFDRLPIHLEYGNDFSERWIRTRTKLAYIEMKRIVDHINAVFRLN